MMIMMMIMMVIITIMTTAILFLGTTFVFYIFLVVLVVDLPILFLLLCSHNGPYQDPHLLFQRSTDTFDVVDVVAWCCLLVGLEVVEVFVFWLKFFSCCVFEQILVPGTITTRDVVDDCSW